MRTSFSHRTFPWHLPEQPVKSQSTLAGREPSGPVAAANGRWPSAGLLGHTQSFVRLSCFWPASPSFPRVPSVGVKEVANLPWCAICPGVRPRPCCRWAEIGKLSTGFTENMLNNFKRSRNGKSSQIFQNKIICATQIWG